MTTPSPKPVKAWAVVGPNGGWREIHISKSDANGQRKMYEPQNCHVIPVLITPIGENDD